MISTLTILVVFAALFLIADFLMYFDPDAIREWQQDLK